MKRSGATKFAFAVKKTILHYLDVKPVARATAFADQSSQPGLEEERRQCRVTAEEGSCCSEAAAEGRGRKYETVDQEVQTNLNCCLGNTSGQTARHKGNAMSGGRHAGVYALLGRE